MIALLLIVVILLVRPAEQPEHVRISFIVGGGVLVVLVWFVEWMYVSAHFSRIGDAIFLVTTVTVAIIIVLLYRNRPSAKQKE